MLNFSLLFWASVLREVLKKCRNSDEAEAEENFWLMAVQQDFVVLCLNES